MKILFFALISIFAFADNYNQLTMDKFKSSQSIDGFSFVIMGDNRSGNNILKKIISKTDRDNDIKFLINNGDLVPDGYKNEYSKYLHIIQISNKPIISIIGNHEIPWYDGKTNYKNLFGKTNFSFFFANSYFVILDSADNKISTKQFNWLENELQKSQRYTNRFVISHVPLYDPRNGNYQKGHSLNRVEEARKLNNLFDQYGVTMFFGSHIHSYFRGYWHKTPYIITGGAGAPLKKNGFYHYIKVIINGKDIKYKIIKIDTQKPSAIEVIIKEIKDFL